MRTFEEWIKTQGFRKQDLGYYPLKQGWEARDEEVAALQRQLEPSPCQVAGHRRADWVQNCHNVVDGYCYTCEDSFKQNKCVSYCLACRREQEIRREERERIASLICPECKSGMRLVKGIHINAVNDSIVECAAKSIRALPEREAGKDGK